MKQHTSNLEALWSRLHAAGDPRAILPPAHRDLPLHEQKIRWAHWKLGGRRRISWTQFTLAETNYLRQILEHGNTSLDLKLAAEFRAQHIGDPENWFEALKIAVRHSRFLWNYGGRKLAGLNRFDKVHLLRVLRAGRSGSYSK